MDGLRTEVRGQQKQSNDPHNIQHNPQYVNYWAPLTGKRHIPPHPAQPQHTNDWAPRTRKRHQQEHRPQRPTERSDPTQHAKRRTGDCPGPRKETAPRRNVTQGAGGGLLPLRGKESSHRRGRMLEKAHTGRPCAISLFWALGSTPTARRISPSLWDGEKRFARGRVVGAPRKRESGGEGLENGSNVRALISRQPVDLKMTQTSPQSGPDGNCSETAFPHDTHLKMISACRGDCFEA